MRFLIGMAMGAAPQIARTELDNGIIVSTIDSWDYGAETALLDREGAYPVERYNSREAAAEGHERWCAAATGMKHGDTVLRLGAPDCVGIIDDKEEALRLRAGEV